jgi:hypothetical protein
MLISIARSGLVYVCSVATKDSQMIAAIRAYLASYPRNDVRRIRVLFLYDGL